MATSIQWPPIAGTVYSVPAAGEVNWASLSNYLVALQNAQATTTQKVAIRTAVTTPVTVAQVSDYAIVTDLTAPGAVTVNLPAGTPGQVFIIADGKGDAGTNNITIDPSGAETINGQATLVLNHDYQGAMICYDGADTDWKVVLNASPIDSITPADLPIVPPSKGGTGIANNDSSTVTITGNFGTTLTVTNTTAVTLPVAGTLATLAGAENLTNKNLGSATNVLTGATAGSFENTGAVTLPTGPTTLVGRDTTDTGANRLQNKELSDNNVLFVDSSDTTKKLAFECSGISAATTRTLTIQDKDITVAGTNAETFTGGTTVRTSLTLQNTTGSQPTLRLSEDPDNGTSYIEQQANATMAGNYTITWPAAQGGSSTSLTNDGSGNLSWAVPAGAQTAPSDAKYYSFSTAVAANALTINLLNGAGATPGAGADAVNISFRNATSATGTYATVSVTGALSVVVPSGTTIGTDNGVAHYIYLYALNNAGTAELAVSLKYFDDGSIQSSSAISGGTSAITLYSTTARSNVAIRLLGRIRITEATAGTWASNATEVTCTPFVFAGMAPIITPWVNAGTITVGATTSAPTKGTTTTDQWWYRRVGDTMEFKGMYQQSGGSGTTGTGTYTFLFPSSLGLTVDTAKMANNNSNGAITDGVFGARNQTSARNQLGRLQYVPSQSAFFVYLYDDTADAIEEWASTSTSITFAVSDMRFSFSGSIPITEWG